MAGRVHKQDRQASDAGFGRSAWWVYSVPVIAVITLLWTGTALALQPLERFLNSARRRNPASQKALAEQRQGRANAQVALGALLPSLTLQGVFTHNQFDAKVDVPTADGGTEEAVIVPKNQLDGYATLNVPLVDIPAILRYSASRKAVKAADERNALTRVQIEQQVTRVYYELLGAAALAQAAASDVKSTLRNQDIVKTRHEAGAASDLDLERATANVERARQNEVDATLAVALKRRELADLSGLRPAPVEVFPEDDLHEEKPLAHWMKRAKGKIPELKVADAMIDVAKTQRSAADAAWAPVLSASAQERITNATGFQGQVASYTLSANLTWRLDATLIASARAEQAAADIALADAQQAALDAHRAVHDAWQRVQAGIRKSQAARAQAAATKKVSELASVQYANGIATQLDVVQAQQDTFNADVLRIQADVDVVYARRLLRLVSGQPLCTKGKGQGRDCE